MTATIPTPFESDDEARLATFGLSSEIIHNGLRSGASRAANRSALALDSSPGTDIYHDGMEDFARLLAPAGWRPAVIDLQPRLVYPDGRVAFAISSGVNVGRANLRKPRTNRKGKATRAALAALPVHPSLFHGLDEAHEVEEAARVQRVALTAPLYFLLCERVFPGSGLVIEFSRPARMTRGGQVNDWSDRIPVAFLDLEGDHSVFDNPDGGDEFDVPVEPR
jgi:hypothetical protein